ncbi:MAG: c-type cytochrome [Bacteroidetes bacterium]|nr:c-type cytochrome [Bacteroidota bacterium]MBI3482203.1 c-type cytochrome [Bacteroidota bacterium]
MRPIVFILAVLLFSCSEPETTSTVSNDADEAYAGGTTTSFDQTSKAFTFPIANISAANLEAHNAGDAAFEATFVSPPALINGGLGPLFNNVSCVSCHNNDGRAKPLTNAGAFGGLLFRISSPGVDARGGPAAMPGFGTQIQTHSIFGVEPEMEIQISYTEISGKFADGTDYSLQQPTYSITNPYMPVPVNAMISPRIANSNFGLGLLEAVSEKTILNLADENDTNGDGISGKANYVYDFASDKMMLGRFGWKASQPTLIQQSAAAANNDMGVTSSYFPNETSLGQAQDVTAHGPEMSDEELRGITVYLQTLAPPARRNVSDATVMKGKTMFVQAQCATCHTPKMQTGSHTIAELSNQTIRPFTDLLLHDMGDGLADNRPDYLADGREWRTAPLWGIGLTKIVNGHTNFLHDGRARNLTEAILWHGGEAENSKQLFLKMGAADRNSLIKFIESL